jgi:transposase-like protein
MEVISPVKRRLFRSEAAILELLREQQQSGLSIQSFCSQHSISSGSFHNWKKRHSRSDRQASQSVFTPLQVNAGLPVPLFAEVGDIRLYQPVSAAFLKELAS